MRIFTLGQGSLQQDNQLPTRLPAGGFCWLSCTRQEFEEQIDQIQSTLQALAGTQLLDLHVSDLRNPQLPSHYDATSQYDLLVFRRLATRDANPAAIAATPQARPLAGVKASGPPVLRRIDTSPVGCALFDQVLLTVHPGDCSVRDAYASKLLASAADTSRALSARLPSSPADLMLRLLSQVVDGYLELRRELSRQLDHWQTELLQPKGRFNNWSALLDARTILHTLDEICEDQRAAMQEWLETLDSWPLATTPAQQQERDQLRVRSRDVLEHIERVVHHVQRLEHSAEAAVQLHFSVQSHRTNDIMRTLTVLTAIFLPLNLIAGIFGMNFEFIPLIHGAHGFWWVMGGMLLMAIGLALFFWRKRYLARSGR